MTVHIAHHPITPKAPCFIIAEAGVNHNGDMQLARQLVDVAAAAGADAVKFQTFKAERLVTRDAPQAAYQAANTGQTESQFAMLKRLELLPDMHTDLQAYCAKKHIMFLSTPFDEASADFLHGLGVPAFKLSSGDLTNTPLLAHIARLGRPMIVSTGMATLGEVETAVQTIHEARNEQLVLLHCVSNYPAADADTNLRAMATLEAAFGVPVGYSDHTLGIDIPLAAVALGARVLEKHFTLNRDLPGPDHQASLEPDELRAMVAGVRRVEAALGDGRKVPAANEAETRQLARKSIVAVQAIPAGAVITAAMLGVMRPGTGYPPAQVEMLAGRTTVQAIPAGTVITPEMLR